MEIIKKLNIEVSKPNVFQAVVAKQYDMNTRFIEATLVDGGENVSVDPKATVKVVINALRKDGESKGFDGVVNGDGTVTVPLHSWMLELDGAVICDISIIDTQLDDEKKLTTTSFTLLVEKAAFGGESITTDPQYDVLVQLLETCSEAGTVAQEALEKSAEANSKYDACVEATERANQAASGVVTIEQNSQTPLQFWVGTKAEYDAITTKDQAMFYIISDDNSEEQINARFDAVEEEINNRLTVEDLTSQITDIQMEGSARLIKSGNLVNFSFVSSGSKEISKSAAYYYFRLCQLPDNVVPAQKIIITPYVFVYNYEIGAGEFAPQQTRLDINENGIVSVRIYLYDEPPVDTIEIMNLSFNTTYLLEG